MKQLTIYSQSERAKRIVARGEVSGHAHIIIGGTFEKGTLTVENDNDATIKHLIEDDWMLRGNMKWTGEHADISLKAGKYKIALQREFSPTLGKAVMVRD